MTAKNESRRSFLKAGLSLSAGAALGAAALSGRADSMDAPSEKIKLVTADGRVIEVEKYDLSIDDRNPASIEKSHYGLPGRKFVMVIDLAKCKNARKCVEKCQEGHYLPEDHEWLNIYLLKDSPESAPYWFPRPCFQCDNPLCVSVCPVGATFKRTDGIVLVDTDRCIGCKFCMTGCPYSARVFHWHEPEVEVPEGTVYSPETAYPAEEGTVGKCVFCADLLRKNELPRCVVACPEGVIYFGDLNEDTVTNGVETMVFSELIKNRSGYRYHEDLGTRPSVYYLPPVDRLYEVEEGFSLHAENPEILERYKNTETYKKYFGDGH